MVTDRVYIELRFDSLSLLSAKKTGGKGIRTPGLLIANETLYQLSYTPDGGMQASTAKKFVHHRGPPPLDKHT